jgi:hypothetical protein
MKIIKTIKNYIILIFGILLCILLIVNEYIIYGVFAFIFFTTFNFIRTNILSRLRESDNLNKNLRKELEEVKSNKLNVLGLKEILDIGLLEVNTKLTRVWNYNFEEDKRTLNFIGAIDVNIIAKFGLDLTKVEINEDIDKILITNTRPHLISFSDLEYSWKISELLEQKNPILRSSHWRKTDDLVEKCNKIKEDYQKEVHNQIKNGPEELNWIIDPLHDKIKKILSHKYKKNEKEIIFVSNAEDSISMIQ